MRIPAVALFAKKARGFVIFYRVWMLNGFWLLRNVLETQNGLFSRHLALQSNVVCLAGLLARTKEYNSRLPMLIVRCRLLNWCCGSQSGYIRWVKIQRKKLTSPSCFALMRLGLWRKSLFRLMGALVLPKSMMLT